MNFFFQVGGFFVTLLLWQHFGRMHGWQVRPSQMLNRVAGYAETFYRYIGHVLVWLASFYHYLYFYAKELAMSLQELLLPIFQILSSPAYVVWGLLESAATYTKPELIWVGLGLLITAGFALLVWCFPALVILEFYVTYRLHVASFIIAVCFSGLYFYWKDIWKNIDAWFTQQQESARAANEARNAEIMRGHLRHH